MWQLRHVEDTEAVLDDSGVYVVVHRIEQTEYHKEYSGARIQVRADLMNRGKSGLDEPIMSFQGTASAVRKALIRFIVNERPLWAISREHAAYIGYELLRAELTPGYVQD